MLISIYLDSNNIVWESESNKKEARKDFIAKVTKMSQPMQQQANRIKNLNELIKQQRDRRNT